MTPEVIATVGFFILIGVRELAGSGNIVGAGVLLGFLALVALKLISTRRVVLSFNARVAAMVGLLVILYGIGMVRGARNGHMTPFFGISNVALWGTTLLFGTVVFLFKGDAREKNTLRAALVLALPAYTAFNGLLYALGVRGTTEILLGKSQMLGLLGISANRALFPTAQGLNDFGAVAGASLVAGIAMLFGSPRRWLGGGITAVSLIVLLMVDSRLPLLLGLLIGLSAGILARPTLRMLPAVPVLLPTLPLAALLLSIYAAATPVASVISRNSGDLGTLNSRSLVWGLVGAEFLDPAPVHVIGYGAYGQVESGITAFFKHKVLYLARPEMATTHNALMQYTIDIGAVGGLVFLAVLLLVLLRLRRTALAVKHWSVAALAGMVGYFGLAGVTEVALTPYHVESFSFLLLASLCAAGAIPQPVRTRAAAPAPREHLTPATV